MYYIAFFFLKKWASFSFIFGLFKQTIQFLEQINVKKCPSSILRLDLNPRPLEHVSSPITTRPWLPPYIAFFVDALNAQGLIRFVFAAERDRN